ncbi:hypothetical protein A2U01_0102178, partial [Trifolium medium]|nr:hypothetical protein [Trifolium medium]
GCIASEAVGASEWFQPLNLTASGVDIGSEALFLFSYVLRSALLVRYSWHS